MGPFCHAICELEIKLQQLNVLFPPFASPLSGIGGMKMKNQVTNKVSSPALGEMQSLENKKIREEIQMRARPSKGSDEIHNMPGWDIAAAKGDIVTLNYGMLRSPG
jgi:hypothetical protein